MLVKHGHMEARAYTQNQVFDAGVQFARAQGIVPGSGAEPRHPGRDRRGDPAREAGESKVILFNLCGHGHFDMQAYDDFLTGRLPEIEFEEAALADGLASLPGIPVPG